MELKKAVVEDLTAALDLVEAYHQFEGIERTKVARHNSVVRMLF